MVIFHKLMGEKAWELLIIPNACAIDKEVRIKLINYA
jgi:hypothetical protein